MNIGPMTWQQLRAVGNIRVLKASYAAFVAVPFLAKTDLMRDTLGFNNVVLASGYFAFLLLAVANLVYDLACPAIVKRFASPNDLYREMLVIKNMARRAYPCDNFEGSLSHCITAYRNAAKKSNFLRSVATVTFLAAGTSMAILVVERTIAVIVGLF